MGWVSRLHGKTVGLDTAPLIFYIEENPDYIDLVDAFFDDLIEGKFEVVTSTIARDGRGLGCATILLPNDQANRAAANNFQFQILRSTAAPVERLVRPPHLPGPRCQR